MNCKKCYKRITWIQAKRSYARLNKAGISKRPNLCNKCTTHYIKFRSIRIMKTIDKYGVTWNNESWDKCPVCGQPDSCGDCNHEPLTRAEIIEIDGELPAFRRLK